MTIHEAIKKMDVKQMAGMLMSFAMPFLGEVSDDEKKDYMKEITTMLMKDTKDISYDK